MDLVAKRFEARYLEVEGKPRDALAIYGEIIAHFANEPPDDDLLPVYIKAAYLTIKQGDRPAGVALLLRGAEHYADHGKAGPVTELCQHLPRLDPSLTRLHLRFARRMLEQNHVGPACELLKDLADRRGKTALRQTLNRMVTWPEPIVRGQLLEFLDRAEAKRRSTVSGVEPADAERAAGSAAPAPAAPPPKERSEPEPAAPPPLEPEATPEVAAFAKRETPKPPTTRTSEPVSPPPVRAPERVRATGPRRLDLRDGAPAASATPAPPRSSPEPSLPPLPPDEVEFITEDSPRRPSPHPPAPPRPEPEREARRSPPPERRPRPSPPVRVTPLPAPPVRAGRATPSSSRPARRSNVGLVLGMVAIAAVAGTTGWFLPRFLGSRSQEVGLAVPQRAGTPQGSGEARPDTTQASEPPIESPVTGAAMPDTAGTPVTPSQRDSAIRPAQAALPPQAVVTPPPAVTAPVSESPQQNQRDRATAEAASTARRDTARPVVREPEPEPAAPPRPAILRVDYPLVMVEGLEVVRVAIEGEGAARRVVVLQLVSPADTLELRAADLGASAIGVGGGRILVSPHPSGGAMGTARIGRFLVTARSPTTTPDVLEPLLQRLVELDPG